MLGPDTSGPGEDMSKQPSVACLTPHLGTWRRQRTRPRHRQTRPRSPDGLRHTIIGIDSHRAVKASPAGGLRPALTALPSTQPTVRAQPVAPAHRPRHPGVSTANGHRYAAALLDRTRCFRHAVPERSHRPGVSRPAERVERPMYANPGRRERSWTREVKGLAGWGGRVMRTDISGSAGGSSGKARGPSGRRCTLMGCWA